MTAGRKKSRQRAERITGNHTLGNAKQQKSGVKKKTAGKKKTVIEAKKAQLRATRRKRKSFR